MLASIRRSTDITRWSDAASLLDITMKIVMASEHTYHIPKSDQVQVLDYKIRSPQSILLAFMVVLMARERNLKQ